MWAMFALFGLFVATAAVVGQEAALMMFLITALPILFVFGMLFKLGFRPNTQGTFRRLYAEALPRGAVGLRLSVTCGSIFILDCVFVNVFENLHHGATRVGGERMFVATHD